MKKLARVLLLVMTSSLIILTGCQSTTKVPAAATKTETQITEYVQKVNQLYSDGARKTPAQLPDAKKQQITTAAKKLARKITPNLYMSGISNQAKKDFKAAKKDLKQVAKQPSATESTTSTKSSTHSSKKTSAFFDADGIVKTNINLGEEADYTGHPKKLADYQEAKVQQTAIAAVTRLFTSSEFRTIPATLTTQDFSQARASINKSTHDAFKTKYLAYVQNAENQFKTYSGTQTTRTTQRTATNTTTQNTTRNTTNSTNTTTTE